MNACAHDGRVYSGEAQMTGPPGYYWACECGAFGHDMLHERPALDPRRYGELMRVAHPSDPFWAAGGGWEHLIAPRVSRGPSGR